MLASWYTPHMRILPANSKSIQQAIAILQDGGVVCHATETCYGLACDLSNKRAVQRLFDLKIRPREQPVSGLFSSLEQIQEYVQWTPRAQALGTTHLPGPLTLIVHLRWDAPRTLYPSLTNSTTIGVRLSSHPIAQQLTSGFGSPISTTSANLHSHPNTYSLQEVIDQFQNHTIQPELFLDSGELPRVPPSTIIDLTGEQTVSVRKGEIELS